MAEETGVENSRISNFEGLVTLTLDRVILHTVVHHLSTATYIPKFYWNQKNFVDVQTDIRVSLQLLPWLPSKKISLH